MKIFQVTDSAFIPYGRIVEGHDVKPFLAALEEATPLPKDTAYVPEEEALQSLPCAGELGKALFGGLPAQFGWCNGRGTRLNCLEYHRSSEFLLGTENFGLMVAKLQEVRDRTLDTSLVKAFLVPAGVLVELYATTLHYAPSHIDPKKGFRVMVVLPRGTNTEKPEFIPAMKEDWLLLACNKWLLAHPESGEAKEGAFVGLTGPNPDFIADTEAGRLLK